MMAMTTINKKIQRRTQASYAVLTRTARPIVVALLPQDILEFREAGCRTRFTLAIDDVFRLAIRMSVEAARRAKREGKVGYVANRGKIARSSTRKFDLS